MTAIVKTYQPISVLNTKHTVFTLYNFRYNIHNIYNSLQNYVFDFKLSDNSRWTLQWAQGGVEMTLVSLEDIDNSLHMYITIFYSLESHSAGHLVLNTLELKKLPLIKKITVDHYVKYIDFHVGFVKDINTELSASVSNDFQRLLQNEELSDVVILVDKKEFKAHKAILAARSPVFSAMFRHDMTEKKENRVEIEEVESETFQEFLSFIYSGNVSNLKKHATKLLPIAERYQMDDLKQLCEISMMKNINVNNVSNVFVIANINNYEHLKQGAIEFIKRNWKDVVNTTEFEDLNKAYPDWGIKIVRMNLKN